MSDATMSQTDSSENLSESNMTAKDSKVLGRGSNAAPKLLTHVQLVRVASSSDSS